MRIAVYCPVSSAYADRLIEGALRYVMEHSRIRLRDFRYQDAGFRLPRRPPQWGGWKPDGILCNIGAQPGLVDWLGKSKVPIVNTSTDYPQDVLPSVHCTGAGKLAAEHLSSLGLRYFGFVGHEGRRGSELLKANFARELARRGHATVGYDMKADAIAGNLLLEDRAAAEPGLRKFLRRVPKPIGLFALDDDFARVVCRVCHELRLEVPGEVAILGLEDTIEARTCDPPLSTIRPPGEEVGYHAMRLLDGMIGGAAPPREPTVIQIRTLIERASTRKRPAEHVLMTQARSLIEKEGGRGLRVQDVARALNVSRSLLQHRYREQFGHPPGEAIARARIERAKQLLGETDVSVTRISRMVGFARSSIFGDFFRRHVRMTPSEFRRSRRGRR